MMIDLCDQPLDMNGQSQACPCSNIQNCPKATIECRTGTIHDLAHCHNSYGEHPRYFAGEPFSKCKVCIWNLRKNVYQFTDVKPFKERIDDLPF